MRAVAGILPRCKLIRQYHKDKVACSSFCRQNVKSITPGHQEAVTEVDHMVGAYLPSPWPRASWWMSSMLPGTLLFAIFSSYYSRYQLTVRSHVHASAGFEPAPLLTTRSTSRAVL